MDTRVARDLPFAPMVSGAFTWPIIIVTRRAPLSPPFLFWTLSVLCGLVSKSTPGMGMSSMSAMSSMSTRFCLSNFRYQSYLLRSGARLLCRSVPETPKSVAGAGGVRDVLDVHSFYFPSWTLPRSLIEAGYSCPWVMGVSPAQSHVGNNPSLLLAGMSSMSSMSAMSSMSTSFFVAIVRYQPNFLFCAPPQIVP